MSGTVPLNIRRSRGKGRGVFAGRTFKKNSVIEVCPVIVMPAEERPHLNATILHNYYFSWRRRAAIALGWGSLYNHSFSPNARYRKNYRRQVVEFVALRDIAKGEEITVNYNGSPHSRNRLWFSVKLEARPINPR